MQLKDFVQQVLIEINAAVDEARTLTTRDIKFSENDEKRTVEFDIAVSAEASSMKSGKAGIKVLEFAEAGGNLSTENKNSTVSRITFGVRINPLTKAEDEELTAQVHAHNRSLHSPDFTV